MSSSLIDSPAMNILRGADGFCHIYFVMYFCHGFVLPDRRDAEMFLTFATDSSVVACQACMKQQYREVRQSLRASATKVSL